MKTTTNKRYPETKNKKDSSFEVKNDGLRIEKRELKIGFVKKKKRLLESDEVRMSQSDTDSAGDDVVVVGVQFSSIEFHFFTSNSCFLQLSLSLSMN